MNWTTSLCAAAALTLAAATGHAQSLGERKAHAQQEAELAKQAEFTNGRCGTALQTRIDWSTFTPDDVKQSVVAWCAAALGAMEDLCSEDMGKQAVKAKVKVLTCAGAAQPAASLAPDGTLTFSFSLTPNQNKLLVRDYLEKAL